MNNEILSMDKLENVLEALHYVKDSVGYADEQVFMDIVSKTDFNHICGVMMGQTLKVSHNQVIKAMSDNLKGYLNREVIESNVLYNYVMAKVLALKDEVIEELPDDVEDIHRMILSQKQMESITLIFFLLALLYYRFAWETRYSMGEEDEKTYTWQLNRIIGTFEDQLNSRLMRCMLTFDSEDKTTLHLAQGMLLYMRYFSGEGNGKNYTVSSTLNQMLLEYYADLDSGGLLQDELEASAEYVVEILAMKIKEMSPNDTWLHNLTKGFKNEEMGPIEEFAYAYWEAYDWFK